MPQSVIVTGASSGIGRATATHFLDSGWNVGLLARRADLLADVCGTYDRALALPCDVTDPRSVKSAFAKFIDRFGRLDTLFNNAGVFTQGRAFDEIRFEDWKMSVDVNLTGSFNCAQQAFSIMRHQSPQGGRIINNGSISATTPRQNSAPYTATKHAITGLTKSISLDGRALNIVAGQIDIGNAGTEMVKALSDKAQADIPNAVPDPIMEVTHAAKAVFQMAELPLDSNVLFMTIMASQMEFVGRG